MADQPIKLDFKLTQSQQEAFLIHSIFASKGIYDDVRRTLPGLPEATHVLVEYSSEYNDNWYDVEVLKLSILDQAGLVLSEVPITSYYNPVEVDYAPASDYETVSFIIPISFL